MDADWRCPRTSSYLLPVRVRRVSAGLCLAAMLVAGCSSDPGHPRTLPSLTATPTPSATSSATDLEAATSVVRAYYALLNQLVTTMDPRGIASLMTGACPCRQQLTAISEAQAKQEHYIDHVDLVSLTPVRDTPIEVSVLVEYNAGRGGLVDAHGRTVTTSKARNGVKRLFRVTREADRWLIADIASA